MEANAAIFCFVIVAPNAEKKAISSSLTIGNNTSIGEITEPHSLNGIYTLQGIYTGEQKDINQLPKGVYILNGKKIMVR